MAFAVTGGHVSRAVDFYKAPNKYFIIGGTENWNNGGQDTPPASADNVDTFKLRDVVGLKRVANKYLVVPASSSDEDKIITYRNQRWRKVSTDENNPYYIETALSVSANPLSTTITLKDVNGFTKGSRVRVGDVYEGIISNVSGNNIELTSITSIRETANLGLLPIDTPVYTGALIERATHVYIDCTLDYDSFPVFKEGQDSEYTYRQVGLCTNVSEKFSKDTLLAPGYQVSDESNVDVLSEDDIARNIGILEVLDNRNPAFRSADQKEQLSLIIEF